MPDWKTHRLIERILLGKNTGIEKWVDIPPSGNTNPFTHREEWGHDDFALILTYLLDPTEDKDLFKAHVIHLWLDTHVKYKDAKRIQETLSLLKRILNL